MDATICDPKKRRPLYEWLIYFMVKRNYWFKYFIFRTNKQNELLHSKHFDFPVPVFENEIEKYFLSVSKFGTGNWIPKIGSRKLVLEYFGKTENCLAVHINWSWLAFWWYRVHLHHCHSLLLSLSFSFFFYHWNWLFLILNVSFK